MFPSNSAPLQHSYDPRNSQSVPRTPLTHSQGQPAMNFSTSATSSNGAYQNWGASGPGGTMNDPFTPSRSHYQPGFLMSANQSTATPPGGQHFEEPPIIPTKFNPSASRASPSEFGLESMFERTTSRRQRQPTSDEDAPPTASVNDIMDEAHINPFHRKDAPHSTSPTNTRRAVLPQQQQQQQQAPSQQITHLIVFGYPLERYDNIVRLFQSLGDTTEPEPSENRMWFTIGFRQPWEAERALRRNGKIMDDSYVIGVGRANGSSVDAQVEGSRTNGPVSGMPGSPPSADNNTTPGKDALVPSFPLGRANSSLGLPLTLAPASAAFKPPSASKPPPQPSAPQQANTVPQSSTLSKISDMIFGW
ncbi:hypothetical protein M422DRAFT_23905 [Sphaerobolus stellatus SS14]|nr:hypothetical protein M422DRAFT_23905 [Sphaerobolus stellatus SS14]